MRKTITFLLILVMIMTMPACQANSLTETGTTEQKETLLGDADRDGEVSIIDATCIQRYLVGLLDESGIDLTAADVDREGVDITDATWIQRWLVNLTVPYRINEPVDTDDPTEPEKPLIDIPQTGYTTAVPAEYTSPAEHQGTVEALTYETKDYVRNSAPISKTAYVYLPYGYDANDNDTRYDILYLMHGWGGHAGEYFEFNSQKNMFDHLIENGDMPPIIMVSASFYNENSDRDFSSSIEEFRQFHLDFKNALMPAVEGKYHTYAKSASDGDLKASRNHRAFGGFSLGSVTTWLQFCYDSDYIRYFLPMSGSCWYYGTYGDFRFTENVDFIEQLVKDKKLDERGYFIYHAVGTNDSVKYQSESMADEMLSRDTFTPDHYVFYHKQGGYHDFNAVQEYLYNALPLFFQDSK